MNSYQRKSYTVLLMRPDYIKACPNDSYMMEVTAVSPEDALAKARAEVMEADGNEEADPKDYACMCLIEGWHEDKNPEV